VEREEGSSSLFNVEVMLRMVGPKRVCSLTDGVSSSALIRLCVPILPVSKIYTEREREREREREKYY